MTTPTGIRPPPLRPPERGAQRLPTVEVEPATKPTPPKAPPPPPKKPAPMAVKPGRGNKIDPATIEQWRRELADGTHANASQLAKAHGVAASSVYSALFGRGPKSKAAKAPKAEASAKAKPAPAAPVEVVVKTQTWTRGDLPPRAQDRTHLAALAVGYLGLAASILDELDVGDDLGTEALEIAARVRGEVTRGR